MPTIQLRGNRVGVEKIKKQSSAQTGHIKLPDAEEYLGVVRYVGSDVKDIKIGDKAYFTTNCQQVRMAGAEIFVMDEKEVLAIVTE